MGVGLKGVIFQDCVAKLSKNMKFVKFFDFSGKLNHNVENKNKKLYEKETVVLAKVRHKNPHGIKLPMILEKKKVTNWMRDSKWIIIFKNSHFERSYGRESKKIALDFYLGNLCPSLRDPTVYMPLFGS
uniref:Protein kinase domain-containing protein n=1 Tax=Heterorhabditis bacteriophora TaxID=37862 RepID=A0A1I7WXB1_HETBA